MADESDIHGLEELVRRHSQRPGFRLVDYPEVGLPYYALRLRASLIERKRIAPLPEYMLRAISSGLLSEDDIAGVLGLDALLVRNALIELRRAEQIDLIASAGERLQTWSLTKKGEQTLASLVQIVPQEETIPVFYNGIVRRVEWVESPQTFLSPRELREAGLLQLKPMPSRAPHLGEISIAEVDQTMRRRMGRDRSERELLMVKSVLGTKLLFRHALMLIFKSLTSSDVQVAFIIDGFPSPEHDRAFALADGPHKQLISQNVESRDVQAVVEELLPPELRKKLGDVRLLEKVADDHANAAADAASLRAQLETAEGDRAEAVHHRLSAAEKREEQSRGKREEASVRLVPMLEHRGILEDAVNNARHRLLINSPWVSARVVNISFIKKLHRLLKNGVELYIAYGLDSEPKNPGELDRRAEADLRQLAHEFRNFRLARLGDTHAKVLVCDTFAVVTSFNWLSFRGDPKRTFRDERGVMFRDPDLVEQQFQEIASRMKNG